MRASTPECCRRTTTPRCHINLHLSFFFLNVMRKGSLHNYILWHSKLGAIFVYILHAQIPWCPDSHISTPDYPVPYKCDMSFVNTRRHLNMVIILECWLSGAVVPAIYTYIAIDSSIVHGQSTSFIVKLIPATSDLKKYI